MDTKPKDVHVPILIARNLSHRFSEQGNLLQNISFSLDKGEALGILGPNGAGKTTLLKILVGALKPTSGELFFDGKNILKGPFPHHLFSYVPQSSEIDTTLPLSVSDMVMFGRLGLKKESLHSFDKILEVVGLFEKKHYRFSTLSGGERQRTLLARALIRAPQILVLDEPTNGLDSSGQDQLIGLLRQIQKEFQTSIVMVGHDIGQMVKSCDRLLCLNRTLHWHDRKEMLTPQILASIYHCEFEHLMIHLSEGASADHTQTHHQECDGHDGHNHEGHSKSTLKLNDSEKKL